MHEYAAKLLKVVDGDTVDLRVDLGHRVFIEERYRIIGINAPELHSTNPAEVMAGEGAQKYLTSLLGGDLIVKTLMPPKGGVEKKEVYGRYLATISSSGLDVGAEMVKAGHAISYDGKGKRTTWPWKKEA